MSRKIRTDSIATEIEMATAEKPQMPAHVSLPQSAIPIWDSIIETREYNSWTKVDLDHAANLAFHLDSINKLRDEIPNASKKERAGLYKMLDTLSGRAIALTRIIQVHAVATNGDSDEQAKRNRKQRDIKRKISQFDDLLAKPTMQ